MNVGKWFGNALRDLMQNGQEGRIHIQNLKQTENRYLQKIDVRGDVIGINTCVHVE